MAKKNLSRVRTGNTDTGALTEEQLAFMGKPPAELRGAAADLKVVPPEPPAPEKAEKAEKAERKRTTVYLTPEHHRRLKVHCISRGLEMSKVIDGLVADYLEAQGD